MTGETGMSLAIAGRKRQTVQTACTSSGLWITARCLYVRRLSHFGIEDAGPDNTQSTLEYSV